MKENPNFEADHEWFKDNLPALLQTYPGEYIAVIGGQIIVHDPDLGVVTRDAYSNHDERPIFMHKVEEPRVIYLPSVFTV